MRDSSISSLFEIDIKRFTLPLYTFNKDRIGKMMRTFLRCLEAEINRMKIKLQNDAILLADEFKIGFVLLALA